MKLSNVQVEFIQETATSLGLSSDFLESKVHCKNYSPKMKTKNLNLKSAKFCLKQMFLWQ